MKLKGHHDLIHELTWSSDDSLLLSSSADGSVKVWNVSDRNTDITDKLNHLINDKKFFVTEMIHPSYVYSSKFFLEDEDQDSSYKIIATICYDQTIRFWSFVVNMDGEFMHCRCIKSIHMLNFEGVKRALNDNLVDMEFLQNPTLPDYVHPNCLTFDRNGRMYIGDAIGLIRVWDVSYVDDDIIIENNFIIKHKELEDDTINSIKIDPNDEDRLFVHSRDSCIRIIEYNHELKKDAKVKLRFFGAASENQMINSCISPDGNFLASGSETGNICIWNVPTGELFSQNYNNKFLDTTCDVDWNPKYNMLATSGFSHNYPILIYAYEKTTNEINFSLGKSLVEDDAMSDKDTADYDYSSPKKRSHKSYSDYSNQNSFTRTKDIDREGSFYSHDGSFVRTPAAKRSDRPGSAFDSPR